MNCPKCGFSVPPHARYCPVDQTDCGFPNVRAAESPYEVNALEDRYTRAIEDVRTRKCLTILQDFGPCCIGI